MYVDAVATLGADACAVVSDAFRVISEKGSICDELGKPFTIGRSASVTGNLSSIAEKKISMLLAKTPFGFSFWSTIKDCVSGLTQFVDVVTRLIVSCVTAFSFTFSLLDSIGLVEEIFPVLVSRSPWTLKIFSATDSEDATVSVSLSVRRKSFSPLLNIVAGSSNSPARTPFASAVNTVARVGVDDATAVMFPFALESPVSPFVISPVENAPVYATVAAERVVVEPFIEWPIAIVPDISLTVNVFFEVL